MRSSTTKDADSSELEIVNLIREQFRIRKNISKNDLDKYIRNYGSIFDDFSMESENSISRVGFTYSGIELVHFCANDAKCDYLRQVFKDATLGGVIFWHFIVDIILRVRKLIGCQYLFLFAADLTPDEHLVNYYKEKLKFEVPSDLGVNKPFYDFTCKFMC